MTVNDKRKQVAAIIGAYYNIDETRTSVIDLVTDIKHFLDAQTEYVPFAEVDRISEGYADEERCFDADEELFI
jgi:hypothetical protein